MVDVGTGTGFIAKHFAPKFDKVLGLDLSKEQLRVASETNTHANLSFHECDGYKVAEFVREHCGGEARVDFITIG